MFLKPLFLLCVFNAVSLFAFGDDAHPLIEASKAFTRAGNGPFQEPIAQLLDELAQVHVVIREGTDANLRPVFVNAQADFERAIVSGLQSKKITQCILLIHTPAPATPLCTQGEISEGLVDPAILHDPQRLLTVKKRPDIIRDYIQEGRTSIHCLSSQGQGVTIPRAAGCFR